MAKLGPQYSDDIHGKSVELVINDRAPHAKDRIIDVSDAATRQLGMLKSGTAKVRIEILDVKSVP